MGKTLMRNLLLVSYSVLTLTAINYVSGQTPYNSVNQVCCNGTVHNRIAGNPACCGHEQYDTNVNQCCQNEKTIIPLTIDGNSSLTCCGGKGVVAAYNQRCCGGILSEQPQVSTQYDNFACCNEKIYITNRQSCCNGIVSDDAAKVLECCNGVSFDSSKSICCRNNILPIPATTTRYSYQCCGTQGYDTFNQICDSTTQTVYQKPANASCSNAYTEVCGGKVLNPNQQCCNNQIFNAPVAWIQNEGQSGYLGVQASCCRDGNGIIHDPTKEACCKQGAGGVIPIDLPFQICCGNQVMDTNVNTCCNEHIVPGPTNNQGCCGDKAQDVDTEICCGNSVYEKSDGYNECCIAVQ